MLNIPSSVKALFQADGVHKNFRVHFPNGEMADITNDNVVQESVKFTESLCSQSTFKFGLAEASVLEFETVGIGNMYGMTIEASCEIDCSSLSAADKAAIAAGTWDGTWDSVNEVFAVPYGTFRVDSCPRDHQSMAHRQVTAYSTIFKNITEYPNLPKSTLVSKIYVRQSALMATMFGTGLVVQGSSQPRATASSWGSPFWDSSGTEKYVNLLDYDDSQTMMAKETDVLTAFQYDTIPAFISANMPNYDAQAYEAFGVSVANALTSAGFDLTYNQAKTKVFNSNEEALRNRCPWMFFPCVFAFADDGNNNGYSSIIQQVKPDTLVPAVAAFTKRTNAAFWYNDEKYNPYRAVFLCAAKYSAGNDVRIAVGTVGAFNPQIIPLSSTGYLTTAPTVTAYGLTTYDEPIVINNTGTGTALYRKWDSQSRNYIVSLTNYTYTNSIDLIKLINGTLETKAMFLKTDRLGGFETIRLENLSPQSIVPENYSEAWWDEFDVAPIGTVIVTYKGKDENGNDAENTTAIAIGTGASEYDMSDNETLKKLSSTDLASVTSLINTQFAPYVNSVGFTPIELNMQGWPWLEAGDALEIEAEDGTTVETYALRVEMSGIQNLQAVITAEGGEIIEEVE